MQTEWDERLRRGVRGREGEERGKEKESHARKIVCVCLSPKFGLTGRLDTTGSRDLTKGPRSKRSSLNDDPTHSIDMESPAARWPPGTTLLGGDLNKRKGFESLLGRCRVPH